MYSTEEEEGCEVMKAFATGTTAAVQHSSSRVNDYATAFLHRLLGHGASDGGQGNGRSVLAVGAGGVQKDGDCFQAVGALVESVGRDRECDTPGASVGE